MKRKCLRHIWLLAVLLLVWIQPITAYAYEGRVVFGSESYSWSTGKVCPIGIYMESDAEIGEYEIWVEYDETVLSYLNGATSQNGNQLYIKGNGASNKTMLHFEPIAAGSTSIRIVGANCATPGNEAENISPEVAEVIHLSEVPVTLYESDVDEVEEDGQDVVAVDDEVADIVPAKQEESVVVPKETIVAETTETPEETEAADVMLIEENETVSEAEPIDEDNEELRISMREGFLKNPLLWCLTSAVAIFVIAYLVYFLLKRKDEIVIEAEEDEAFLKIIDLDQEVIKVNNVTMRFRLAQEESSSLKEYMIRTVKGQNHYHYLTALDNIGFDVKQGDVVGIIGTNGSGKSTLLKIIAGSLTPTEGHVEVDKRKIQMLTLGTGFDMELTAKENVYLNGAIIGYTREYIDEKYDDIVAFAELEGFMDERMKNFSSGMVSRLGFAIATMRDAPDILILDEVLSVGDMFFKEKSMNRIREMIHGGATVLIVSHSPDVIINNCNRAVWIEKGVMQMIGNPKEVCEAYKKYEIKTTNL